MSNPQNSDPESSRPDSVDSPVPADPLLRNGSFIDPSETVIDATPLQSAPSANGAQSKPRRKVPVNAAAPPPESASWLPPGWMVEERVRTNGATAGTSDRYYIEPVTGRRFRSKKEVQYYLETGETPKDKKKREAANGKPDVNSPEISGKQTNKKAKKPKVAFDHKNVPDKVEWVLTGADDDVWTPFIGGEKVPVDIKQSWESEMPQ